MADEKKTRRQTPDGSGEIFLAGTPEKEKPVARRSDKHRKNFEDKGDTVRYRFTDEHTGALGTILFAVVLMTITALVAGLLGFINAQTKGIIEQFEEESKNAALESIFPDADEFADVTELLASAGTENVTAVYKVMVDGEIAGYCAAVTTYGYSSSGIQLMVGSDLFNAVKSVSVVSQSETPSIGAAVLDGDRYLGLFTGMSRPIEFSNTVTAVSGATITSTAVKDGINEALEAIDYVRFSSADTPEPVTEEGENNG